MLPITDEILRARDQTNGVDQDDSVIEGKGWKLGDTSANARQAANLLTRKAKQAMPELEKLTEQWTREFGTSDATRASGVALDSSGVYVVGQEGTVSKCA